MTDVMSMKTTPSHVERGELQDLHTLASDPQKRSAILRKVDWRIVPIMLVSYFLQFLDKVLVNYANVMGLQEDLQMSGNDFSWMATAFFIGFAIAEIPQGYCLQRFPIHLVLGINVFCWGIIVACTSAARSFIDILALRILLGCCEAVISPALVLTTSTWYTKQQSAPRYGIWYCGLGLGQIIGGLVSFASQHGPKTGYSGWRIMMLSVGVFNSGFALIILTCLPSTIDSAKFLSANEKELLRRMLILDQAGNGKKVFKPKGLFEVFTDLQVWLLFLLTILIVTPSGVITTFSAVLIRGFGYNAKQSALLNMPSGVVSITATLGSTYAILRGYPRWLSIIILLIPSIIGAALMSFMPIDNQGGGLAGIYLINTIVAPLAIIFSWVGVNTAGYTKMVGANAMIAVAFSLANIIGPLTFQARDQPEYLPAKITVFAVAGGAMVISVLLKLLYMSRNVLAARNREAELANAAAEGAINIAHSDLTDRKNPAFVYGY